MNFDRVDRVRYMAMVEQILALAPRKLTLLELRRRVRGRGTDQLRLNFVGRAIDVSPEFGCALERLAFSGLIYLTDRRGPRVVPGRNYFCRVSAAQRIATVTRILGASVPPNPTSRGAQGAQDAGVR